MSLNLLNYFLVTELSAFFLIFCRIGAALMAMPGFGDTYVAPRIRLLFALTLSLMLTPLLTSQIPAMPGSPLAMLVMMLGEIVVGVFMGLIVRILLSAMHVAGTMIAAQSSLAVGAIFDPNSGAQSPVISNILSVAAITLFFALNFHHLVLAALVQSYDLFTAGQFFSTGDMANLTSRWISDAFTLGVLLSTPHVVFSLVFYLIGGLMTRLMPNFQVFFILMSPQIMIALLMFLILVPTILTLYNTFFENHLMQFVKVG